MLDNQEQLLPDATENQSTESTQESVPVNLTEENLEPSTEVNDSVETPELESTPEISTEILNEEAAEIEENIIENPEFVENTKSEELVEIINETEALEPIKKSEIIEPVVENLLSENSQEGVEAIEEQVALDSVKGEEVSELPMVNYGDSMPIEQIVATLKSLIAEHPVQSIGKHVEELKRLFNLKFGTLLKDAKTAFLAENEEGAEFHYENPIQKEYNEVLFSYKKLRQQHYNDIEKVHAVNLIQKNAIIEELKDLIENGNPDTMYKKFRDIQTKWRAIGPVPRDNYADTWQTYHFHVERFYDLLHLSNELREMDFKHNYEEKMKLVQRVEVLAESEDVKAAFEELQILHRLWKEEIGPVSREHREEVWNRFSEATNKIHNRRHEYFEVVKGEFEENLKQKELVLEELDALNKMERKTHNDWQKSLKDVEVLRKKFIETGRVPRSKDKEIWERFREINRVYNQGKNEFYKDIKKEQQDNLDRKMKLVAQAEALRESEDWDNATEVMKHIQSEWKNIGHVPKQLSDKIWNRFKEACNHYFDRLHKAQDSKDEELMSVYLNKKVYLEKLKEESEKEGFSPTFDQLKAYINEWKEMGSVPAKQRYIEAKFNKFLDPYFENLSSDKTQSMMVRYKNMIDSFMEQKDTNKIYDEINFVRKKLELVTKEKQQMETNRQYFSNADDNNPMMRKILNNIEKLSLEIEVWDTKLQYLRSLSF
jgi:hypothetical protein